VVILEDSLCVIVSPMHQMWPAMLICSTVGCVEKSVEAGAGPSFGSWYATDLHVHSALGSNDALESTVADLAAVARERALSLIVITEHSNSAGSMDCETGDVEDCPNQGPEFPSRSAAMAESGDGLTVVTGLEISPIASLETTMDPTGHIGCIPRPGDPFAEVNHAVVDRPAGTVSGGAGIDWCHQAGGLAVVNHPFSVAGWIAYDWTDDGYDALEIFNGGGRFDLNDAQGVDAWLCDLAQGRETIPLGGSDTHQAATPTPPPELLDQALGFPTTWVQSDSDDADALLEGLTAGRVVVGDPRTHLDLVVWDGEHVVGPGETLQTVEPEVELKVEARVGAGEVELQVLLVRPEHCDDSRFTAGTPPVFVPEYLYRESLPVDVATTARLTIEPGSTVVARVWPADGPTLLDDGVAIAAAVVVVAK